MPIKNSLTRIKHTLLVNLTALGAIGVLAILFFYFIHHLQRTLDADWRTYNQLSNTRAVLLHRINSHLGYGGFIHHFKNYVLRQDEQYLDKLERDYRDIIAALDELKKIETKPEMLDGIDKIRATIDRYYEKVEIAKLAAKEKWRPLLTDKAVRVDDTLAVLGLSELTQAWLAENQRTIESLSADINHGTELIYSSLAGLLIYVALMFFLFRNIYTLMAQIDTSYQQLQENKTHLQTLIENTAEAIITIDTNGIIDTFNSAAERLFGYAAPEIVGKNITELLPEEARNEHIQHIHNSSLNLTRIINSNRELFGRHRDGHLIPVELNVSPYMIQGQRHYVGILRDIGQRMQLEMKLREQATRDALTGIYNRRAFFELAGIEFTRSRRHEVALSLLLLDCDYFKAINDQYGHLIGDEVLQHLASECVSICRKADVLGRYGGEEFIILLPDTDYTGATELAERLLDTVHSTPVQTSKGAINLTVSIGIAIMTSDMEHLEELIEAADKALYRAKLSGRDQLASA